MKLHIVGLPHTQTTPDYVWCAYTAKITKFCTMMTRLGYEVYLYGGSENSAEVTEHVEVVDDADREKWFGHYDWDRHVFNGFQSDAEWWVVMNARVVTEITKRAEPGDMLGIIAGGCQQSLAKSLPDLVPVEWGIGYSGVWAPYRVYESYAWMHYLAARRKDDDVRYYDTVIPNYFDPADFNPRAGTDGEYLLFLGRHTARKGLAVVKEITERSDIPVITAGQGSERVPGAKYVGVVRGQDKADLIAGARALLCPTTYLEPFGGVAVEAMLSGTPAISTDYGAFTETIAQGVSGYRCSTLGDFMHAVREGATLDRQGVIDHAQKYTMENVAPMYDSYFKRLEQLQGDGWYTL